MNRTFRVVFNRARGALMVANELTASVRSKGTKTVVAAAVAAVAGSAFAADYVGREAEAGGALQLKGEEVVLKGDLFENNKATGGYDTANEIGTGYGGAIHITGGANVVIEDAVFRKNSAWRGGAVSSVGAETVIIRNSRFEENSTEGGEYTNKGLSTAGAVQHEDGLLRIENSVFAKNRSQHSGGAVATVFTPKNFVEIDSSRFVDNTGSTGGALSIYYGFTVSNSLFEGNKTHMLDDGGGVAKLGGHAKVEITGSDFVRNTGNIGGALSTRYADGQDMADGHWLHIEGSSFAENSADAGEANGNAYSSGKMFQGDGGAVWNGMTAFNPGNDSEENRIVDSTFENNVAKNNGGAFYNQGNLRVGGTVTFSGNEAKKGGAVYTDANDLTLDATAATDVIRFTGNKASVAGSDLYVGDLQRTEEKFAAPWVHLTGEGSILFEGGIAGVQTANIRSVAREVRMADASGFEGTFTQEAGSTTVSGAKYFGGTVDLTGGKLTVEGEWTETSGTKLSGGTLATAGKNVFAKAEGGDWATTAGWQGMSEKKGVLELTDTGFDYTLDELKAAQALLGTDTQLSLNGNLRLEADDDLTAGNLDGLVVGDVTVDATESGEAAFTKDTTVGAVDFGSAKSGSITGTGLVTVAGKDGDVFVGEKLEKVTAEAVRLGIDAASSGRVSAAQFEAATLDVTGDFRAHRVVVTEEARISGALEADSAAFEGTADVTGVLALTGKLSGETDAELSGTASVREAGILTTNRAAAESYADRLDAPAAIIYADRAMTLADGTVLTVGSTDGGSTISRRSGGASLLLRKGGMAVVDVTDFVGTGKSVFGENVAVDAAEGGVRFVRVLKTGAVDLGASFTGEDVSTDNPFVRVDLDSSEIGEGVLTLAYAKGLLSHSAADAKLEALFAEGLSAKEDAVLSQLRSDAFLVEDEATGEVRFNAAGESAFAQATGGNATAGVLNVAYDANEEVTNAIVRHQLAAHRGYGAWADVFMTKNEAKKLYGDTGYEADIAGGIFGFDATFSCGATAGIALTIGRADADSVGGLLSNSVESDFFGASVYAAKEMAGLHVKADLGYLDFSNDFSGIGDASDASSVTFGVRGDFTALEAAGIAVKPHFGLRYTHIDSDAVAFNDAQSLNVFEMPVGVAFEGAFEAEGWKLVPSADVTLVPQLGEKEVDVFADEVTILHSGLVNTKFGLEASRGNLSFGLNAGFGFGTDDRANTSVNANVRYAF